MSILDLKPTPNVYQTLAVCNSGQVDSRDMTL